jgi:hypothetical protein
MSYSALGIANSGFGASILAVLLIWNYIFTKELSTKMFLGLFIFPIALLLNSFFHVYYSDALRQIADFWIVAAPIIWLVSAILFWAWRTLKKRS